MNAAHIVSLILLESILTYVVLTLSNVIIFVIGAKSYKKGNAHCFGVKLDFVVVTKASRNVIDSLIEVIRNVRTLFPDRALWVVTDDNAECLDLLKRLTRTYKYNLVVVPRWYSKGKHKARALNFFIENYVVDNKWYAFLDDDSYPTDTSFLCELDDRIPVYNGILVPRRGKSVLAWLADAVRYYSDLTKHRFALITMNKPIYGLHGELLISKGWALKDIGFETDSVSEDSWFAAKLVEKKVKTGQVTTRVSILSPNSIYDFIRQRGRWFAGRLRDFLRGEYPPLTALAYLQELLMALALPLSPFLIALKIIYSVKINPFMMRLGLIAGIIGLIVALTSYSLVHLIEYKKYSVLLLVPILLPVFALLEMMGVSYGLVKYRSLTRSFLILNKSTKEKHRKVAITYGSKESASLLTAYTITRRTLEESYPANELYESLYHMYKLRVI